MREIERVKERERVIEREKRERERVKKRAPFRSKENCIIIREFITELK